MVFINRLDSNLSEKGVYNSLLPSGLVQSKLPYYLNPELLFSSPSGPFNISVHLLIEQNVDASESS